MRENHDYVTMETYKKDMEEISSRSTCILKTYDKKLQDANLIIWALVQAAGGKISVHDLLMDLPRSEMVITRDEYSMSTIYEVKAT